jgi:[ribosomal protein S5]-alanine N-acetyltransferase
LRITATSGRRLGSAAHRLEAGTDVDNVAEQKALERIGFTREGVLREVAFRDGAWRNTLIYGLLRQDWETG